MQIIYKQAVAEFGKVQVQLKLKRPSTKLNLKLKREVQYFFSCGWLGCISAFKLVEVEVVI